MPAEHRVRRDQEGGSRQNPAQRRQEQAIGRSQAGPTSLPLEDSELVTEGHYFDPELRLGAKVSGGHAEERSDDGVEGARIIGQARG